jgi:hypothetical protein
MNQKITYLTVTVELAVSQRFLTDSTSHILNTTLACFSRWASKMTPKSQLQIVAAKRRRGFQQASIKRDVLQRFLPSW